MASIGTTELIPLRGELVSVELPIAASQTIKPGDPVKLVNGLVTRCASDGAAFDTDTQWIGIADFNSVKTVNGVSTSLAAGVFVKVFLIAGCLLSLPTKAGTAPTLASHFANGANTGGFALWMTSGGQLQVDLGTSTKGMVRPFGYQRGDWADGHSNSIKSTTAGTAGDRVLVMPLSAGMQVIF